MTVKEFINKSEKKLKSYNVLYAPFVRAVKNTVAMQATRIFIDGKNSSNGIIGQYSTKPMYVNPEYMPSKKGLKPTKGKGGKHKFKNKKVHRTTYLGGGYKELRNRMGKRIDRVNLTFSGDMQKDFCNGRIPSRSEPNKISEQEYTTSFKRKTNIDKREGLENKYGTIFNLTKSEKDTFAKTLEFNFKKALKDG